MKKEKDAAADGLDVIDRELYLGKPDRQARLEQARADAAVARKIYDLRAMNISPDHPQVIRSGARIILTCISGFILFPMTFATEGLAGETVTGGYSVAAVSKAEVIAAANFAINAEEKAMQEDKNAQPAILELADILSAQEQVVAGMNYRLKLKVMLNGKEKAAEAVVWRQAWKTHGGYQLTSWEWK